MKLLVSILFAIQLVLINAVNIEYDEGKLLVTKNILNNYVVENLDVTVRYTIYNVGNQAAHNVRLQDDNFPADSFEYVEGFPVVSWQKVSPSSNVSHVSIVRPRAAGMFNFTHAAVTYAPTEGGATIVSLSSEMGPAYIQRLRDYNRRFASHLVDWVLFVIMTLPSILFPYILWYSSKRKYENVLAKAKKEKST